MLRRTLLALTGCLLASASLAEPATKNWDGLEPVHSSQLDEVYLRPGADFSGYRAILLEPIEVAFRRHWLRDLDETRGVQRMSAAEMDKLGADFDFSFNIIRERLGAPAVAVQIPIGQSSTFEGIIDLIRGVAIYFNMSDPQDKGRTQTEPPIPEDQRERFEKWRHDLLEKAAETDDRNH